MLLALADVTLNCVVSCAASELFRQAAQHFEESGDVVRAAECKFNAAKLLEEVNEDDAVELFFGACDYFSEGDKDHYAANTFRTALSYMLKKKRYGW